VVKYDPMGDEFDPNLHMGLFNIPDAEKPAGTVAVVTKVGPGGYCPSRHRLPCDSRDRIQNTLDDVASTIRQALHQGWVHAARQGHPPRRGRGLSESGLVNPSSRANAS